MNVVAGRREFSRRPVSACAARSHRLPTAFDPLCPRCDASFFSRHSRIDSLEPLAAAFADEVRIEVDEPLRLEAVRTVLVAHSQHHSLRPSKFDDAIVGGTTPPAPFLILFHL